MNLNKYRDEAFRIATSHGFHDEKYSVEHWICLIISELMEAVEADRKGFRADLDAYEKYATRICFDENFERHIKDTIEDELSDACIRIFDLAGENNIDLDFFRFRIKRNQPRCDVHGKDNGCVPIHFGNNQGHEKPICVSELFAYTDIHHCKTTWYRHQASHRNEDVV